jgi:hypothetical protein
MTKGTSSGPQRQNTVPIIQDLEGTDFDIPPPAYGDHHDQLQLSQAGFAAGAAVTGKQSGYSLSGSRTLTSRPPKTTAA